MIPSPQPFPIFVRAYAESVPARSSKRKWRSPRTKIVPSPWTLTFDTETKTDAGQALRIGVFQLRNDRVLVEHGIFYDPDLPAAERELVQAYAAKHKLSCLSRDDFVDRILFEQAYAFRATFVGFNLPFDFSRLAIAHASARGTMQGGFSFTLSADKRRPHLQIKHLTRKSALIRFAAPFRGRDARSDRKRRKRVPVERGRFVDVRTLPTAMFSRPFKLKTLSEFLNVPTRKQESDKHGQDITEEYLEYAVRDVQATWECYQELVRRYAALDLKDTPPPRIYSEASIGKAYLKAMGVRPWRELQTCPASLVARILSTYFGGRSEVRIRRELRQVVLCDFLSMYPTVCTLMGLWRFVVAEGMTRRNATEDTRELLDRITLADLQNPEIWRKLTTLVRVHPDGDVLPVRSDYDESGQATIGANYLTADGPLWITLADCIASKLQTGKAPRLIEATFFEPVPYQTGLQPVALPGTPGTIDPIAEDFYKRLIELREALKAKRDAATGHEYDALDAEQNAVKIAANATSYGIFVEIVVEEVRKKVRVRVHHPTDKPFELEVSNVEKSGRYFQPLLATLITGAARLMLATAERLVADHGLEWAFCDTDSMAIAKPEAMERPEFLDRVNQIVAWFGALNPYDCAGSILKIEDVNLSLDGLKTPQELYCWAVSAKRYALFNIEEGRPILRKASAHGLGHLRAPYNKKDPTKGIPAPAVKLSKIGVKLWQHDLWWIIASAAVSGRPDEVDLSYHPALQKRAVSRYAATTPKLLKWFSTFNGSKRGSRPRKPYAQQVKPFGFLLSLFAKDDAETERVLTEDSQAQSKRLTKLKPIAPHDADLDRALQHACDRDTGLPVPEDMLKSYADVLEGYHLHREAKFLNSDHLDRGSRNDATSSPSWIRRS